MKRSILVVVVLVLAAAAAMVYLNWNRPAPAAATLVPESTLVFLDMPHFAQSRADFQRTAVYALWQEPEMQAFLAEPLRTMAQAVNSASGSNNVSRFNNDALDALQGEVFVAVTRISAIPKLQAGLILGADVKHKRLQAKAALALYEHRLADQHPEAGINTVKYLGVNYTVCEIGPNQRFCHTFLNSMLVFTVSEDDMRDVIARFTGQVDADTPSLAASPKYQDVLAHLPPGRAFVSYLNIGQVMSLIGPFLALAPQGAATFQKMARIQANALSVAFDGDRIQDVGFTAYATPEPVPPVLQRKTLGLTTPHTCLYAAGSEDVASFYQGIMDSIAQSQDAMLIGAAGKFEQVTTAHGLHVRDDLLSSLGPEVAVIATWRDGAGYPDTALAVEIKNAAQTRPRLDIALEALRQAAWPTNGPAAWEESPYLGETLHTVHSGPGSISPTYVVTDSFFILALTPVYARELVKQLKEAGPTLASNPDYQQATQPLPANANSAAYCEMNAVFRPLYARLRASLANTGANGFVDPGKLPQADTIARHLSPYASATVTEEKSETTTAVSSLGKPLTFVLAATSGFIIAQPWLAPYLPTFTPAAPTASSSTAAPLPPAGNQTAQSQTPATP